MKIKKAFAIIKNIFVYALLCFALCLMLVVILSKKTSDGNVKIFGYESRIVLSNSMEKCDQTDVSNFKIKDIPVKSMIFIETVPSDESKREEFFQNVKVGDVLTFKYVYAKQETITHRVTLINKKSDKGYEIYLEGDNKSSDSKTLKQYIDTSDEESFNYIIGKVKGVSIFLGYIVYVLKKPVGSICLIIIPCFLIIVWEVIKIINVIKKDQQASQEKQITEKDEEIRKLKEKLEKMKNITQKNGG